MKSIRSFLIGIIITGSLAASLHFLHAQETAMPVQSVTPDSIVQLTADSLGLSLISPDALPVSGTFFLMLPGPNGIMALPYPCPPGGPALPTYSIIGGVFLVDGTGGQALLNSQPAANSRVNSALAAQAAGVVNLVDQVQGSAVLASPSMRMAGGMMMAADDTTGPGGVTNTDVVLFTFTPDYGTNLYIAQPDVASNYFTGIISNTFADIQYEIQYTTDLTEPWQSANWFVYGSEVTNWTPFSVPSISPTNLFLRVRSWQDDGSGLPVWWQEQYFGTTGVDPNTPDAAGDGWTVYQKFQMGLNPNTFYTPPAPQGLTAVLNIGTNTANVSWQPSLAPVTGYTVTNSDGDTFNFSAGTEDFEDNLSADVPNGYYVGDPTIYKTYQVQAHYAGGNSAWSAPVALESPQNISAVIVKNGSQGVIDLVVSAIPANTAALRLNKVDEIATGFFGDDSYNTNWDIPISSFTNGIFAIPASWAPVIDAYGFGDYAWWIQAISANGDVSVGTTVENYENYNFWDSINGVTLFWPAPFFDGRAQLKQNLIFQLRSATVNSPFQFNQAGIGETAYPDSYACAGFNQNFDKYKPVEDNYLYRNFVFNTSDLNSSGRTTTGVGGDDGALTLSNTPAYQFSPPATFSTTLATVLSTNTTRWLASYALDSTSNYLHEIGVTNASPDYVMFSNVKNYWGLPFLSAEIGYGTGSGYATTTLSAGGYTTQGGYFYPETAQPQFETVEYDFWNPNTDWLPGGSGFSTTNKSDLLIVPVGGSIDIAGYAKLSVQNGYSGVYGYLQQYFTNAYTIDTNGAVTTNTTGILSPYGSFFANQPGAAALVIMPDIDTGAQGTCTVYCVSLILDKNHDGIMDTSFSGQDGTSASSPFQFWIDGNYDRLTPDEDDGTNYEDDVKVGDCPYTPNHDTPDCNYRDFFGNRIIPTKRDLEDYTRLWVAGITSNLLAALPVGSTVTLNWGDVGSPNTGNPTIDFFAAADADGGIGYQTNETIAAEQTNNTLCPYIGRLAPGGSIQLNASTFANNWAGNHFIWCGVSNGTGGLNLTIADGSGHVLVQTTAYIQIQDIKQMYERWTIGDQPSVAPLTNAVLTSEGLPPFTPSFQYAPPQDTNAPYILLVHGWNLEPWNKDRWAETAFKRLYWQGYQGRFGEFRWPTDYGFNGTFYQVLTNITEKDNYDNSEYRAWQSAQGLLNKLNDLNAQYPNHVYLLAHSMGNVVAGEALRLSGNNQVINTYVASQGAIPAHIYDASITTPYLLAFIYNNPFVPDVLEPSGFNYGPDTPNIYGNRFAGNFGGGAGSIVSFYNTNDFALAQPRWGYDQITKPDTFISGGSYYYNGSTNDSAPWNHFEFLEGAEGTIVFDIVNSTDNLYTVMAFAAEARSTALGATPGVLNFTRSVDLTGIWPPDTNPNFLNNPYGEHFYHSAEFRGDNAMMQSYWSELLGSAAFNLK